MRGGKVSQLWNYVVYSDFVLLALLKKSSFSLGHMSKLAHLQTVTSRNGVGGDTREICTKIYSILYARERNKILNFEIPLGKEED